MPEELKLLTEWKKRLFLDDWFIILETNVKEEDMSIKDADGTCEFVEATKVAKIQVIDPDSDEVGRLRPFNFEQTLVHELLHIKFSLLTRGNDWENNLQLRIMHQIIDDLSRSLVDAKEYKNK